MLGNLLDASEALTLFLLHRYHRVGMAPDDKKDPGVRVLRISTFQGEEH